MKKQLFIAKLSQNEVYILNEPKKLLSYTSHLNHECMNETFLFKDNEPYQKLIYIKNCFKSVDPLPHLFRRSAHFLVPL